MRDIRKFKRLTLAILVGVITSAEAAPTPIAHILRAGIPPGTSVADRNSAYVVANRFKQISAPDKMIVARDVSAIADDGIVQISTFQSIERYRDYFYDPIHLQIDRAGEERQAKAPGAPTRRWESFDILAAYSPPLGDQLLNVARERRARFTRHDDRPIDPPVGDRPQDQKWGFGHQFFWFAEQPDEADAPGRAAANALDHLSQSRSAKVLVAGTQVRKDKANGQRRAIIFVLSGREELATVLATPEIAAAVRQGGFLPDRFKSFFAIDPDDGALAQQLGALLAHGLKN